ncbi:MAG TPA: cellulase family glycosylhydrolase [Chloroflexia bacterium]|nr:cellulase family glycosylhydrolase [Chloroflexia bacterium]
MKHKGTLAIGAIAGLIALLLSTGFPALQPAPLRAQGPAGDYLFTQTGFTVPATFMNYWQSHGGLAIFGYPISPAQSEGGYQVQYFERNRFELHPEFAGTVNEVELGLLGSYLTSDRTFPLADPVVETPDLKYFMQTGHRLGGIFYRYWQSHGGLALFGYPISEELQEGGYTVQYFQRNRFEYHPEHAGTDYEVQLGLLGRDYMALVQTGQVATGPGGTALGGKTSDPSHPAPPNTAGPTAVPLNSSFLTGPHIGYGMIVHMYYQPHQRIINAVKDIGFTWIKQQVQWSDIESPKGTYYWGDLDSIVNDCNAAGLNVMLSVVRTPAWATASGKGLPDRPQDLGDFMQALSAHYAGRVKAYEIWNEENLGNETGDAHWHPDVYAEVLKAGFLGTRAGDPTAVVISGALTPTGVYNDAAIEDTYFLDQLYQWHNGEIRQYYDVLGIHPYGYWNPPDAMFPVRQPSDQTPATEYNNHGSFYFRRIEDQRAVMEKHGDGQKQVWVTEFGWCSDQRDGGYVECIHNSLQDQANYIVRAYQKAQTDYPYMGVMFLWNLNFSTFQEWYTGPSHFSILNPDWSPRPAYWALKNMAKP